jgi:hypothetical protein
MNSADTIIVWIDRLQLQGDFKLFLIRLIQDSEPTSHNILEYLKLTGVADMVIQNNVGILNTHKKKWVCCYRTSPTAQKILSRPKE